MGSVFVRSRPLSKNMHGKCWLHATMLEVRTIPKLRIPFFFGFMFFRIYNSWNWWEQLQPESLYATSNHLRNLSLDTVGFDLCVHHIGQEWESHRQGGWMTQQPQFHGLALPAPFNDLVSPTHSQGTGVKNACKVSKPKEISSGLSLSVWLGTRVGEVPSMFAPWFFVQDFVIIIGVILNSPF